MRKVQQIIFGALLCAAAAAHARTSVPVQTPDGASELASAREVRQGPDARKDTQGRPAQPGAREARRPLPDASKRDAARPR